MISIYSWKNAAEHQRLVYLLIWKAAGYSISENHLRQHLGNQVYVLTLRTDMEIQHECYQKQSNLINLDAVQ